MCVSAEPELPSCVASGIGFDDTIISAADAIRKHKKHPRVENIRREFDEINGEFDFRPVTVDLVMQNIKNINPKKATGYDNVPGTWKNLQWNLNTNTTIFIQAKKKCFQNGDHLVYT